MSQMEDYQGKPICVDCYRKNDMVKTCPCCGVYMVRVRSRLRRHFREYECPGCYPCLVTPGGWRKEQASPLVAAAKGGIETAGKVVSWGVVIGWWSTAMFLIVSVISLGLAIDYFGISKFLDARVPNLGKLYFWGPKVIFAGPYAFYWTLAVVIGLIVFIYRLARRRSAAKPT